MIFILQTSKPNYRLRSYADFVDRFSKHHKDVRFYGPQHHGMENAPEHIIPEFTPGLTMQQTFDKYLGGNEPEALFLFSSSALTHFAPTDFTKLKCPIFVLITDAVSWDDDRLAAIALHKMKPLKALFFNYMYKLDELKAKLPAESYVHYPCWAAHCYDSEEHPSDKSLEFLISGVPGGGEYTHRDIFDAAVKSAFLSSTHSKLGERTNEAEDNERFRQDLLRSKYSPHDGGVNGRMVPRYAESCFARSVIISPDLGEEMRLNGYVHNKNCIVFDRATHGQEESLQLLRATAERRDWNELAGNAYELAKTRHCTDIRIRKFLEMAL